MIIRWIFFSLRNMLTLPWISASFYIAAVHQNGLSLGHALLGLSPNVPPGPKEGDLATQDTGHDSRRTHAEKGEAIYTSSRHFADYLITKKLMETRNETKLLQMNEKIFFKSFLKNACNCLVVTNLLTSVKRQINVTEGWKCFCDRYVIGLRIGAMHSGYSGNFILIIFTRQCDEGPAEGFFTTQYDIILLITQSISIIVSYGKNRVGECKSLHTLGQNDKAM